MAIFHGIDFANKKANHGQRWIADDGRRLAATFGSPPAGRIARTAVDCPFGTTLAFTRLLRGEVARKSQGGDVFKSRSTERLLRDVVSEYQLNRDWRERDKADRENFPRASFFNGGSHVQPAVGMVIVPEMLAWLADMAGDDVDERLAAMRAGRLGDGPVVEAHPRLFLYSAMERLRAAGAKAFRSADLDDVAGYKGSDADAKARRERVFQLMRANCMWLGTERREIYVANVPALVATDHAFDAWLSALTAWAHQHGETWAWQAARLERATVEVEGHMLVLTT